MKKRLLSLILSALMLITSVPFVPLDLSGGLAVTASAAVSTAALKEVYDSIPPKSQWEETFINTSSLETWYDEAEKMLADPSEYTQAMLDNAASLLQKAYDSMEYHTQSISLSKTKLSLKVGSTATLTASVDPKNAGDKITWKSSDSSVVSVSDGKLTAKKYSASAVTITATSNGHSAKCVVTTLNPLAGVKLSASSKTIYDNQSFTLKATAIGKDSSASVTDEVVYTWDSSNEKVATVTDSGKVSGVAKGTAKITVIASVGTTQYSAVCTVTVNEIVLVTGFKALTLTNSGSLTMVKDESETFKVQVLPSTATVKALTWTSSNTKVATVSQTDLSGSEVTGTIKAVGPGTAKITYKATDGSGKSGSFTVKVLPLVSALSISETVKVIDLEETDAQLKVSVSPSNAGNQVLDWSSSNTAVCTVDRNGNLTPKSKGTCTITAKTTDGSAITVTCKLRVAPKSSSISLNKTAITLQNSETATLTATVRTVENTTYTGFVEWISDNPKVATVDKNGKITVAYPGTAIIKAVTTDGTNRSAACVVTVKQPVKGVSLTAKKTINLGSSVTLKPTFKPTYAENQNVTWSSSNKEIATVSSSGVVTAKKAGTCTITVKTADGGYTAKCVVTVVVPTKSIKLSKSSASIKTGSTLTLTATVSPSNATDKTVTWSSSNKSVATVNSKGVVTAVAGGKCTITAKTSGGQTASCSVSVTQDLKSISLNKTSLSLYVTQTYTLKKTLNPSTSTVSSFTWKSSNTSVAKVDKNGKITAVATGTATITVSAGSVKASCEVKVTKKIGVASIKIAKSMAINKGQSAVIETTISPSNASNQSITWTSSNTKVATVSSGTVKGVSPGTAVITAKTNDGGYTAKCTVSVSQAVTGIIISDDSIRLSKGNTKTLSATVFPTDANNRSVNWTSTDTSVAKVSQNGVVTAVKDGSAIIKATTVDGGYTATCKVTVYNMVTSIKLSEENLKIATGDTKILYATVLPSSATNKEVTWSSSDKSIVSVSSAGQITGKRKGAAVITAKTKDGSLKATCTVTVVQYATSVNLEYSSVTINAGNSKMLYATVKPSTASNKKIKWSSSNKKVVTVNSEGKITAVAGGSATITATSGDGKVSSSCKITVIQSVSKISFSPSLVNIGIGESKVLKAVVSPATATNQTVTWTSSNTKVATVDSDGVVKGISKGKVNITATSADGKVKGVCKVNITMAVTGVTLDKSVVSMKVGQKTAVTASVIPSAANNKSVTWSTNNYDVATVSSDGVIMAVGPGYAEITAKTKDGGYKAICKVTITQPVKSISLSAKSKTLDIGDKYTLKVTFNPKNASNDTVKWSSSNTSVAKVSSSGVVTALKKGSAVITAKSVDGGYTATCKITVVRKVKSVALSKTSLTLYLDQTATLKATVSPSDATNQSVSWSTSNAAVVNVSSSGKLTPVKAGTAVITVKTADGSKTAKCTVTVEKELKAFALSKKTVTLDKGKTVTLSGVFTPSDATNKKLTWSSSNTKAATVNSSGVVTAVAGGKATITAKTANGLTASCVVTVNQSVSSVSLSASEKTVYAGDSFTLTATVSPSTASNKSLTWSSSNASVASVSSSGKVTAVKAGAAVITVKSSDGEKTASCNVTVKQHVTSIELNKTSIELTKGQTETLSATVSPSNASDKSVQWSSSNKAVVSVSALGKITALAVGEAVITVTSSESGVTASCSVTVAEPVTGLDIDVKTKTIYVRDSFAINAVITPSDASNQAIRWTSSNPLVASVSSSGVVNALKAGEATITAQAVDGGFKASCKITIIQPSEGLVLSQKTLSINVGSTASISATVKPDDCSDKTLTWSSSNEAVATVNSSGKITALLPGTVLITAKTVDNITASCEVTVLRPAEGIKITQCQNTVYCGESFTVEAEVEPHDASNKNVVWVSSNEEVATVSEGVVKAVSAGKATITAKSEDGGFAAQFDLEVKQKAESIVFENESYEIILGEAITLKAEVLPKNTSDKTITWQSEDETIAKVDSFGNVTALKDGTVKITAKAAVGSAQATVSVKVVTPASSVEISGENNVLWLGEGLTLTASVLPQNTTYKDITWSSSNENILTVDQNGNVNAVSVGEAKIIAQSHFKKAQAEFTITVRQPVTEIKLSQNETAIDENGSIQLYYTIAPENAFNKNVSWQSGNESVATVSQSGLVTAQSKGTAVITVKSADGKAEASCVVRVERLVTGIEISHSSLTIEKGKAASIAAVVTPSDATDTSVTWISSNDNVALVSGNGVITAVSAGKATITAVSSNKNVKASCEVTVEVYSSGIEIQNAKDELWVGETLTLGAAVSPSDTTDQSIVWASSNSDVAEIDQNGFVKAISGGKTIISVKTLDTGVTAQFELQVSVKEASVTLSQAEAVLNKGEKLSLEAEVLPQEATYKNLTWESSDSSILSVNQNGEVTALAVGTATISVKTEKTEKTDFCVITVIQKPNEIVLDKTSVVLDEKETSTVSASFVPADTTETDLIWASTNVEIATVKDGVITAVSKGEAQIYAVSKSDGSIRAICSVEVKRRADGIYFVNGEAQAKIGEQFKCEVVITPEGTNEQGVTWRSDDETVAVVDENGIVTAKGEGTANIFAKTVDGGYEAFCIVTVVKSDE